MKRKLARLKSSIADFIVILAGTALFAASVYCFTAPNRIAPGGVTGLATALHSLLPMFPIGTIVSVVNIPLLFIGWRFSGRRFIVKTLFSTVCFSILFDIVFPLFVPVYVGDYMLAALFGGVMSGAGLAVVFMRGGSTGGTDIINRIMQIKLPHISMGRLVLVSDIAVIVFAAAVFRNIESAMYAIVAMFVASRVMDSLMYGADVGKTVTVVTDEPDRVCRSVGESVRRGCTVIPAKGGYTGDSKSVILCAVKKSEFYKLKKAVFTADSRAFLTVSEAVEVVGEGFKNM